VQRLCDETNKEGKQGNEKAAENSGRKEKQRRKLRRSRWGLWGGDGKPGGKEKAATVRRRREGGKQRKGIEVREYVYYRGWRYSSAAMDCSGVK
jgi:hypothetical protein